MGCPEELRPDMSVTDLAYCILKNRGKPLHFKELINEILQVKALPQESPGRLAAQIHTEINLDSRFLHQGGGEWGLRDWQPKAGTKVVRIRTTTSVPSRQRPELLPDDEFEADSDEDGSEDDDEESGEFEREEEDLYDTEDEED